MAAEGGRLVTVCSRIPGLAAALQALLPSLRVEEVDTLDPSICHSTDFLVAEHNLLGPALQCPPSSRLRWAQNTWAGVDSLARQVEEAGGELPTLKLARFSHPAFSQLMAEYCLLSVLSMERSLVTALRAQADRTWHAGVLQEYRSLAEVTVGVLGVGQMGTATARVFKGLGSRVVGLVTSPREADAWVDRYYTRDELSSLLSSCDYILAMLPATPSTDGLLGGSVLSSCKGAGLVSLGRGNIFTEEELLAALEAGGLRAAVLDVFPSEPLGRESLLWTHPGVTVTPHVAGVSRCRDIAECFLANLARYDAGEEVECLVDWNRLY